ncbi:hypothetical protein BH09SUM1_BH09SUM1_20190 [soil metagenome]
MKFMGKEENYLLGLSLEELKILHKALWNDLKARKQLGIDEAASDLLFELQTILQKEAQRLGVDIGIHSEWAAFAGLDEQCSL